MPIKKLPDSGRITLNEIALEFKDASPYAISEERDVLHRIRPELTGDRVKFSEFYGLTNTIYVDLEGTQTDVNIDTILSQLGHGEVLRAVVTVKAGARINSSSISLPAIRTGAFANNDSTAILWIVVEEGAFIRGRGGFGGNGGTGTQDYNGKVGGPGSDAVQVECDGTVNIENNGVIGGGGGGGGGGGFWYYCHKTSKAGCQGAYFRDGGGGLGGTGDPVGVRGNGIKEAGGGAGGKGGDLGENGSKGVTPTNSNGTNGKGANGGQAGIAVRKLLGIVNYLPGTGTYYGVQQ